MSTRPCRPPHSVLGCGGSSPSLRGRDAVGDKQAVGTSTGRCSCSTRPGSGWRSSTGYARLARRHLRTRCADNSSTTSSSDVDRRRCRRPVSQKVRRGLCGGVFAIAYGYALRPRPATGRIHTRNSRMLHVFHADATAPSISSTLAVSGLVRLPVGGVPRRLRLWLDTSRSREPISARYGRQAAWSCSIARTGPSSPRKATGLKGDRRGVRPDHVAGMAR